MYEAIVAGQKEMQAAIALIHELKSQVMPKEKTEKTERKSEDELKSIAEKKKIIVWASKVPVKKKIRSAPPGAIIYKDSKRIDVATSDYYISITHYDTI